MIESAEELAALLQAEGLDAAEIVALPVLDTKKQAFAVPVRPEDIESSWRTARGLLKRTGHWPVVSNLWQASGAGFAGDLLAEEIFSRFYFEEAPNADDVSPEAIIARSATADIAGFLQVLAHERAQEENASDEIEFELEETERVFGKAPDATEIAATDPQSIHDLDHRLLEWELKQGEPLESPAMDVDWFEADRPFLLFLPTASGWETLAYLNFYGTSDHGSEFYIALGQSWEQRYGAELVAHWGTMLQCLVSEPPEEIDDAWELARQHDLIAPCNLALPGIPLRRYAFSLVGADRWMLHERP